MTLSDIASYRLYQQGIATSSFQQPSEVIAWFGAIQGQDYVGAKWAMGLRLPNATDATIEQAISNRTVIRTWSMRGTLHFVAANDIHWILGLVGPRIIASNARRYRQLELDEKTLSHCKDALAQSLHGGKQLTRKELIAVLMQAGVVVDGLRLSHILQRAGLERLVCFGARRNKEYTYTLLDEWAPPPVNTLLREEALAELAKRFFMSRGPATLQDFMTWSGLVAADARAGLEMVKSQLLQEMIEGKAYWFTPSLPNLANHKPKAYLLPAFDEYLLGYKDRSAVLEVAHAEKVVPGGNGIFFPTVVVNGRLVGTWKAATKKATLSIAVSPFASVREADKRAIVQAAEPYAAFVRSSASKVTVEYP